MSRHAHPKATGNSVQTCPPQDSSIHAQLTPKPAEPKPSKPKYFLLIWISLHYASGWGAHEIVNQVALIEQHIGFAPADSFGPQGPPTVLFRSASRELHTISCNSVLAEFYRLNAPEEYLGFVLRDGLGRRALSRLYAATGQVSCPRFHKASQYQDSWKQTPEP